MTVHPECVAHGLAAVRAGHPGMPDLTSDTLTEEHIADTIADLLHLAASAGIDPDDAFDHGRRYYEGDLTDPDHDEPGTARPRHLELIRP